MQLRQLRYFLAVAEELNFTRAAERIGIAQPPLSQQISNLERELGAELFIRSNRSVALTEAGEALIPYAHRLLNDTDRAASVVGEIARGERGLIRIGAVYSAIYTLIPHVLRTFSLSRPHVKIQLAEMTIAQQIDALAAGSIDVGMLRGPIMEPHIETVSLFRESFVAALPADHRLAAQEVVPLEEIAMEPLIIISPSLSRLYGMRMLTALIERNYRFTIAQEVADMSTLLSLVGAGLGVSLVPASVQGIQIDAIVYRRIRETMPTTIFQLAYRDDVQTHIMPSFVTAATTAVAGRMDQLSGSLPADVAAEQAVSPR
ncbi:LysR substrate-binding domain-containing protein [Sphingobium sp.]|uniref:LysR substrate-binding domain-containing protein n=1 Tax=Sphingobium sp. TaxID=1912891 RepID=UPI003B3AD63F